MLAEADALVVACSLTAETMGMVNAAAIAAFKPGGVLVNIARGGVIDTTAVVEALHSGRLHGAGLGCDCSRATAKRSSAMVLSRI